MPNSTNEIQNFLNSCQSVYGTGHATEHSYRKSLEILLGAVDSSLSVLNEPKRQKVGAPDFILFKNGVQIGFVEAKDIPENLNDKKFNNQISRYQALGNLCFTNNLDWKFYNGIDLVGEVTIGRIENGRIVPDESKLQLLASLLIEFVGRQSITIRSSKQLAVVMANKAKTMRDILVNILTIDEKENLDANSKSTLFNEYEAFKKILIHDLSIEKFADLYSQTITYGLFTARFYDKTTETFTRQEAASTLPKSNPFLRKLFQSIAGYDLDVRIAWVVDNLVDAFAHTNVNSLMHNFGASTKMSDPVLHFYETFLGEYDPKTRKATGVYYTPDPVVKFIVKSVDEILQKDFNLPMGLADNSKISREVTIEQAANRRDVRVEVKGNGHKKFFEDYHRVQVLDPATGTGTFLLETFKHIYSKFSNNKGIWQSYATNDLIPRVHGFELLMASYSMAHLKLAMFLSETGIEIKDRLSVYLTNSLEEPETNGFDLFSQWLSQESEEASRIKDKAPVMVVMGNPPYSGESSNRSDFIMKLMEDYKLEPGGTQKLQERNPKWINDDYVKFLRHAQNFVEKNESGIVAFINPHGYLDNPTFRGVRWNLLKTFDKMYILDLHGNSKKKEISPDGSPDVNVFDIQQGVAINIFVKTGKKKAGELATVHHLDLYGKRESKYEYLENNTISTSEFKIIPSKAPMYYMVQKDFGLEGEYEKGVKLSELMAVNSVGIVTADDKNLIAETKNDLIKQVKDKFQIEPKDEFVQRVNYRPFDSRFLYYDTKLVERSREKVMKHMLGGENLGLNLCKQFKSGETYQHALITDKIIESSFVSNKTSEITSLFPLYLYPDNNSNNILESEKPEPNFNPELIKQIENELGMKLDWESEIGDTLRPTDTSLEREKRKVEKFAPVDLLDYIYAVLHSPEYREKYKEFLKIDFPRVPFEVNSDKFWELVLIGGKLRKLHLMEGINLTDLTTGYPKEGNNVVEKISFEDSKVWINQTQYFDRVSDIAWNFYIGGYQPAQKWLKDRKGRELSYDDIIHYQKIVYVLGETARLMGGIGGLK